MQKTKIMHVLCTGSFSGAENVAITIIDSFKKEYENVEMIYVSLDGSIRNVLDQHGIRFEPIKKMSVSELRRVIKKCQPDIIHAHDFTASLFSAIAGRGRRVVSHIHNNSPWIRKVGVKTISYGMACLKFDRMLGVSDSVFDEYVFGKFFKKKEQIIGNPVDMAKIRKMCESAESHEAYDVVFLGRITDAKRPLLFVDIMKQIHEKNEKITAVMIGDGDLRENVEKSIAESGLDDVITLKGFMNNPYGILGASKLLCLTSEWEGFGLVVAEALSLGKPVVASPVGGVPTIITGNEGNLCNSVDEFATSIVELLVNDEKYKQMSLLAKKRGEEIDNMKKYIDVLCEVYSLK